MENPYDSPRNTKMKGADTASLGKRTQTRKPVSLCILLCLLSWTVLMAFVNLVQEGSGSQASLDFSSIVASALLAGFSGFSQVPGLVFAGWRWKGSGNSVLPMFFAAYVIAFTGGAAFTAFALQTGPSDSMNSASHMHIFLFPVMHIVFSVILYLIAYLLTMICLVYSRYCAARTDVRCKEEASG